MLKRIVMSGLLALPLFATAAPFNLTDTQGQMHSLACHQGKWVLVNLWATWCPACISEMPELEALSKSRKDLVVLGVSVDGQNAGRLMQFTARLKVTYPIVAGNAELGRQFMAKGYPTTILYDTSGAQVLVKEGPVTRQEIEAVLNRR